jgi:hypothetical protein
MSLLSTDITKVKRLSLKEVKLPAPELRVEPITPIQVERPPSFEEIAYSRIVRSYPLVEDLVGRLELVSIKTGERIKIVELIEEEPTQETKDVDRLIALAERIIKGEDSYRKEGIVARIKEATNVSQERAEVGFNLMLQAGAIEPTPGDRYYLTGSTPF